MKQAVEDQIRAGKKRFAFTEVYFSGTAVNTIYKYVIKPLSEQYPDCQFKGFWLHEGTPDEAKAALQGTDGLRENSEVFDAVHPRRGCGGCAQLQQLTPALHCRCQQRRQDVEHGCVETEPRGNNAGIAGFGF